MRYLIRSATIIDPQSSHHQSRKDLLIDNGIITTIADQIPDTDADMVCEDCMVSPGWFDLFAQFHDPGEEQKEDLISGAYAAMAGGFTGVLLRPDTHPAYDTKGAIEYAVNKTRDLATEVFPTGALTVGTAGKELTEMYDLRAAGAIAIGNGEQPLQESGLLLRALQYVKPFNGVVLYRPLQQKVADGPVNEGAMSVRLGMKGSPAVSEELAVHEAIELAQYTQSHVHLVKISTAGSVELVRQAKAKDIPVSCSVSALHLHSDETILETFNELYKVVPPLRTADDKAALWAGIADGTVDAIVSDHNPQDIEAKQVEFEYAEPGISSLEHTFSLLMAAAPEGFALTRIIEALSIQPRKILGLETAHIEEQSVANLTFFQPTVTYTASAESMRSKSSNTPFLNQTLTGKVMGVIRGTQTFKNL